MSPIPSDVSVDWVDRSKSKRGLFFARKPSSSLSSAKVRRMCSSWENLFPEQRCPNKVRMETFSFQVDGSTVHGWMSLGRNAATNSHDSEYEECREYGKRYKLIRGIVKAKQNELTIVLGRSRLEDSSKEAEGPRLRAV